MSLTSKTQQHHASEHETKFVFRNVASRLLIQWLRARCQPDPEFPEGIISSIYYDTRDWRFLREKINSDYLKTKVRLRWYADIDTEEPGDESFLEAKYKIGGRRQKIRIRTDYSGKWLSGLSLEDERLREVSGLLLSKGAIIPSQLHPAFLIQYKRLRFVEPVTGARLSIDCDICTPKINMRMIPRTNHFPLREAVFELKGRTMELPNVLHQLTALGCRKGSFSKYSACYQNIMRIAF